MRGDAVAATLIGLLNGDHSLREAVEFFATRQGLPLEMLLTHLPAAVRQLMSLGLVVPA